MGADNSLEDKLSRLRSLLRPDKSFDITEKEIIIAGRSASLFFVDAFMKDEIMEKLLAFMLRSQPEELRGDKSAQEWAIFAFPHWKVHYEREITLVVTAVLSGVTAVVVDGFEGVFLIDSRFYPTRSIAEPQDDRVLRGSHDGFVEAMVSNAAMIRRRIRDTRLTMETFQIGTKSKTDVVLCYMEGVAQESHIACIRKKLKGISIPSLTMGQESLLECLCRRQRYNPFPKVRYTERPDTASASVLEGKIVILIDNSPSAMILPTGIFDFMQDTNEYYFPPLIGSYLRWLRTSVLLLSLFLTPFWYLLMRNEWEAPPSLQFLTIREPNGVPILVQLLAIELIIDVVKLASLNTPNTLSNAFSVVGALIFGEFAVRANLFVPEVLLYMAFVAVSAFTQASYEMGYAFKLMRMIFLVLTAVLNWWGFLLGVILLLVLIATTQTPLGYTYLYPLIPFDKEALIRLFIRRSISRHNA